MKERTIVIISITGLLAGCLLGMAGSVIPSVTFRSLAWATGSVGLILAGALLAVFYFRKGYDALAAGFLIYVLAEAIVFSSCATNVDNNIPSFGAGTFLWALSIGFLSFQKVFPLLVRLTGIIAATLFAVVSVLIFTGCPLNALAKPFPFYAYPFFAATLAGWAWTTRKHFCALKA
ncbi:MAG TPA: hypothetical protein VFP87_05955 [Chitinophagaceae bacterium]|nr:hypothetical protein [Chitinophagaceae bacterium]